MIRTVGDLREELQKYPGHLPIRVNDAEYGWSPFELFRTNHPTEPVVLVEAKKEKK